MIELKHMKKLIFYFSLLATSISLTSCFQEIDTVRQERQTKTIITSEGSIYSEITYFKVYENATAQVAIEPRGTWDLAFQSALEGNNVLVNYTVSATAINTETSNFDAVDKNTVNELFTSDNWRFNDPSFSNIKDSTALYGWENGEVYIVYRGSAALASDAYYKVQLLSETSESYTFRYAHVESTTPIEKTIARTLGLANIYFSFENDGLVEYEPLLYEWDFYFAPYFGWFETLTPGEYAPYNLTGVMINNEGGVLVCQVFDENIEYADISFSMAETLTYTDWKGVIGSTWKKIPNPDNPIYSMDTDKKYVLKLNDGNYYKLRFLDFYNTEGERGYPSFEINIIL